MSSLLAKVITIYNILITIRICYCKKLGSVGYMKIDYRGFLRIGPSVNRPMGLFMEIFPLVAPWAYYQQDKMTVFDYDIL